MLRSLVRRRTHFAADNELQQVLNRSRIADKDEQLRMLGMTVESKDVDVQELTADMERLSTELDTQKKRLYDVRGLNNTRRQTIRTRDSELQQMRSNLTELEASLAREVAIRRLLDYAVEAMDKAVLSMSKRHAEIVQHHCSFIEKLVKELRIAEQTVPILDHSHKLEKNEEVEELSTDVKMLEQAREIQQMDEAMEQACGERG